MKKQTFRAKSMTEAVEVVKRALGPDAVIISVRNVPAGPAWKVWQAPGVEVIAVGGGKGGTISPEAAAMMASELEAEQAASEEESGTPKHLGTPDRKAVNRQAFQAALRRSGSGKSAAGQPAAGEAPPPFEDLPAAGETEKTAGTADYEEEEDAEFVLRQGKVQGGREPEGPAHSRREDGESPQVAGGRVSPEAHEAAVQTAKLITQMVAGDPKRAAQLSAFLKKKTTERAQSQTPEDAHAEEMPIPSSGVGPARSERPLKMDAPQEKVEIPLSLSTPKPKLALDELASALSSPAEPERQEPWRHGAEDRLMPPVVERSAPDPQIRPAAVRRMPLTPSKQAPLETPPAQEKAAADVGHETAPAPKQKIRPPRSPRSETPIPISPGVFIPSTLPQHLAVAYDTLARQGVDPGLLEKTARACSEALSPQTLAMPDSVQAYLQRSLEGSLRTVTPAQLRTHALICVIGPSGVGKTSFTAKLAVHKSRQNGGEVIWISADTVRTGAIAETRMFGDLLGVRQFMVYTPEELEALVRDLLRLSESVQGKDAKLTILVDTPACNPYNENSLVEMGAYLNALPGRTTYLAVPATAKEEDLVQIHSAYGIFKIDGLVVTKLDETRTIGSVYNLAWRSQVPLAYFTSGVRLLEDLHTADVRVFSDMLFRMV